MAGLIDSPAGAGHRPHTDAGDVRARGTATFVVPALLQTSDYSRGVTAGGGRVRPDHTERVVGLRMDRQRRLDSENDPLHLLALIEESVLDRPIGSPAVMRRQLEHLISMAGRDNVEIQVLPTSVGFHDGGSARSNCSTSPKRSPSPMSRSSMAPSTSRTKIRSRVHSDRHEAA
ncbi:MAG: DUF5753 domain-containing protein [Actinomycetota bacterium]|nr:DUF5753 domain-containing protein [Actinomycetota bacterium]